MALPSTAQEEHVDETIVMVIIVASLVGLAMYIIWGSLRRAGR